MEPTRGISNLILKMATTKSKMQQFNGKGDFKIWRQWMRVILVQQKVAQVLQGEKNLPSTISEKEKTEMLETAYNTMILYLSDNVLRKCNKEISAASLWLKLDNLYMTKSLTDQIYLKVKLFGFKMQ
ncbi:LOW QUALITY PROTEIN: hypothetical protein TorRG33x02_355210 [Trema orientale]|uniref:Retrovirus-related Pol polyprotein from transposon TNT 1-94 n=1 Tax=Trema orientale TaxID=63057 RepID=A0A2P5A9N4_TREOI|nr:LOW QUALITY PROTEIN: hypothetical protein TorRG33x02_355210 [Trema orientale]